MTRLILILSFSFYSVYSFSQAVLHGTYLNDRDTLKFHHDSVAFAIMSNGGLIFPIEGEGEYELKDDLLIIRTENNPNKPAQEETIRDLGDREFLEYETLIFKIYDQGENHLGLILLGICDNTDFKGQKTIRKLDRNHKKFPNRQRPLKRKN